MSSKELELFLAAARQTTRDPATMIKRWGPWIALGLVVVIALGGRAVAERLAVACRARPRPGDRVQVPGVLGVVGRRQPGTDVAGDPRRHQAAHQGRAERRRDPAGLHRRLRRVDPAQPAGLGGEPPRVDPPDRRARARARPASCSRCDATATSRISTPPRPTNGSCNGSTVMAEPRDPKQSAPDRLDPERRRQLEEERDFLMQSLDDLELEHESGGIDDESYAELHDDYTARAAGVSGRCATASTSRHRHRPGRRSGPGGASCSSASCSCSRSWWARRWRTRSARGCRGRRRRAIRRPRPPPRTPRRPRCRRRSTTCRRR